MDVNQECPSQPLQATGAVKYAGALGLAALCFTLLYGGLSPNRSPAGQLAIAMRGSVVAPGRASAMQPLRSTSDAVVDRRAALVGQVAAVSTALLLPSEALAGEEGFKRFEDKAASLEYPADWQVTDTTMNQGTRRIVVFTSGRNPSENINLVFTPVPGDYSKIGAFGDLERAGSFFLQQGNGYSSKMLNQKLWQAGDGYSYEYVLTAPDRKVHFRTIMTIIPNDALVTLTTQAKDEDWASIKDDFARTLDSFVLKALSRG